jgi:outer membrane receptor for ferrienterochelin and colicin
MGKVIVILFGVFLISTWTALLAQPEQSRFHVKGKIINGRTKKPIKYGSIKVMPFNRSIQTDGKGEFLFNMPKGEYSLEINYDPFEKKSIPLPVTKDTTLLIELESTFLSQYLDEVEVISHTTKADTPTGINQITSQTLKLMPALNGERDVLKLFAISSGVSSACEGSSEIQVRGGVHGQNLFLLDDVPLYSTQHMMGMVSTYNSAIIKSATLYKSGFPAEYGGKLSGIIDVKSNDANTTKLNGEAELGMLSSKANINIPIIKNKLGVTTSGRISNYSLVNLVNLFTNDLGYKLGLDFADVNTNVTWLINDRNKLKLCYLYNRDGIISQDANLGSITKLQLNNTQDNIALRWENKLSEKSTNQLMAFSDLYGFKIDEKTADEKTGAHALYNGTSTGIRSYSILDKFNTSLNEKIELRCGVDGKLYYFSPITSIINASNDNVLGKQYTSSELQGSAFAQFNYKPDSKNKITTGIRSVTITNSTSWKPITNIEPRLSYHFDITPSLSINASACRMTQPIHRLANSGLGMPFEIFMPSSSNLLPETSWNYSFGIAKDISSDKFQLSVASELWYKNFKNITEFKNGYDATLSLLPTANVNMSDPFVKNIIDIVTQGNGEAYGIDFSAVLDTKIFKLTLDYTLMKATQQFAELNYGKTFDAPTDMRHTINTTTEIKLSDKWTFSAIWQYHTGRPITLPTSILERNGTFIPIETTRNNYRIKEFHRLDIAFSHKYKAFKKYDGLFSVGIYNVYNRANPYLYYIDTQNINGTPTPVLKSMSIFPILPSISWSVRF